MPKENNLQKILEILEKHKVMTLAEVQKKMNNYSKYVYLNLRQLVQSKQIYCVNSELYVYGNPDEIGNEPSGSMPGWYDPELHYLPITRTPLVSYLIEHKPELPPMDSNTVMEAHALYVWYCLAHPRLDTSYLTPKEGYDKDEAASRFITLKDSFNGQ